MKIFFLHLICFIVLSPLISAAQNNPQPVINSVISGVVTDEKTNAPLEGALVKIKGITNQILTDNKGRFSLKTAQTLPIVLEVSFIGYKPIELETSSNSIDIRLQDTQTQLNEVVVVGYGTQRKTDVTGSVASVTKAALSQPVSSFDNMLQGAVSGVAVTQSSSAPGSTATIRVRGGNSISFGNDPLYVIDGFIVYNNNSFVNTGASNGVGVNALTTINPSDIESIEILKDASATAIYGSRGANGVVIISTRRGKRGGNDISYSNYIGQQKVRRKLDLMNATEWMQLVNDINESDSKPPTFSDSAINAAGEGSDWQSAPLRDANLQNHEISVSGGDEKSRYLISGNYFKQDGTVINTGFKRFSGRINYERNLSDKFNVTVNVFGSQSKEDKLYGNAYGSINFQQTSYANLVQVSPAVPIYNEDGSYYISNPYQATPTNIVQDIASTSNITHLTRVLSNISAEYRIVKDLTLKITGGADLINTKQNYYSPSYAGSPGGTSTGYAVKGYASVGTTKATTWINENTLTYDHAFNNTHFLTVLAGYTMQHQHDETAVASAQNFPNDLTKYNNLSYASTPVLPSSDAHEASLNSYLGRVNYSLRHKYNVTATLRADGSSKLGANNRWGYFPSVGLSWNVNQEEFLKPLAPALSSLKLRLSAGKTGNSEVPPYSSLAALTPTNYYFNSTLVTGVAPVQVANPDLKWETTTQYDVGFDAGFLKSRINVVFDVYYKKTTDLLLYVPFPLYTGYASSLQNVGSVENRGIEFSINSTNIRSKSLNWTTNLVFAANQNKVLSLGEGTDFYFPIAPTGYVSPVIVKVGLPVGTFWGYETAGLITEDDAAKGIPVLAGVPQQVGDRKYIDTNGDGIVTADDKHNLGSAQPRFTFGLSNTLTFKCFDFSFFFQGSYGNKIFNFLQQKFELTTVNLNVTGKLVDRYSATNPNGTMPRATNAPVSQVADIYIEDGSYIKLKNLTLGYSFSKGIISKIRAKQVRLYVGAQNIWTITRYTGLDPEVNFFDTDNTKQGIDYGAYPTNKAYLAGLNITF